MDVMQDMMKSLNEITELKRKSCEETEAMITRTSNKLINMINRVSMPLQCPQKGICHKIYSYSIHVTSVENY